jgi:hypothetical protein
VSAETGIHMPLAVGLKKGHLSDSIAGSFVSVWCPLQMWDLSLLRQERDIFSEEVWGMISPPLWLTPKLEQGQGIWLRPQGQMGPCPSLRGGKSGQRDANGLKLLCLP